MTSQETLSKQVEGVGAQVNRFSTDVVKGKTTAAELKCQPLLKTIDQEHKASMNELTKMMTQLRQDRDASQRFFWMFRQRREHSRCLLHSQAREVCLQAVATATSTEIAAQKGSVVKEIGDHRLESVRSARNVAGTAQEVMDEVRRIRNLVEVNIQNQFDWSACEEEQGNVETGNQ